jgi:hypothetical protein
MSVPFRHDAADPLPLTSGAAPLAAPSLRSPARLLKNAELNPARLRVPAEALFPLALPGARQQKGPVTRALFAFKSKKIWSG